MARDWESILGKGCWRWVNNHSVYIKDSDITLKSTLNDKYSSDRVVDGISIYNISNEYLGKARPGIGRLMRPSGSRLFNRKGNKNVEVRTETNNAFWLINHFGGDVMLLKENRSKEGIYAYSSKSYTPDFMWRFNGQEKYWELKEPEAVGGSGSIYGKGVKQISIEKGPAKNKPGGLLVDMCNLDEKYTMTDVENDIARRFRKTSQKHLSLDVIIKKNDTEFKVCRFSK